MYGHGIFVYFILGLQTVIIDDDLSNQMDSNNASSSLAHSCQWCHKQYVLKNKLLKHQRAHHYHLLPPSLQEPQPSRKLGNKMKKMDDHSTLKSEQQSQTVNIQFTGMFNLCWYSFFVCFNLMWMLEYV